MRHGKQDDDRHKKTRDKNAPAGGKVQEAASSPRQSLRNYASARSESTGRGNKTGHLGF